MLIYFVTFFISYKLFQISQKRKEIYIKRMCVAAAILLPSILAGCRDYSIGTDVLEYGNNWFNYARWNNFILYMKMTRSADIGIGYAFVNYVVSVFTDNAHWFYFWLSMLTTWLVYKAVRDNDDLVDVPVAMLTYYLLFYNLSLNALRQSLAMAFGVCAFRYMRKQKGWGVIAFALLAMLAHETAVMVVLMYLIYIAIIGQWGRLAKWLVLIGATTVIIGFFPLVQLLVQTGILSSRYAGYADTVFRGGGIVRLFFICLPWLAMLLLFTETNDFKKEKAALVYYTIISTLISFLAFRMAHIVRIAYYFDIYLIFTIPFIVKNCGITVKVKGKYGNKGFVICFMLIYWVFVYGIRQSGETVPYLFMQ